MHKLELPKYVLHCINKYGNTIVTKRDVKRLGGADVFLQLLKNKGYICKLEVPQKVKYGKDRFRVLDHYIVTLKGRINKNVNIN